MSKDHKIKVGRMILISHGAYSSYQRIGWFVAVKEFSPEEALRTYLDLHDGQKEQYRFHYEEFLVWLTTQAILVEVEEFFDEWHLGDYRNADEAVFLPRSALPKEVQP